MSVAAEYVKDESEHGLVAGSDVLIETCSGSQVNMDCVTGQCFIPASQRPDGTWRKARRVKDGYIPQEEMPLYESKGKQWAKNRPDHPVGLAPEDVSVMRSRRQQEHQGSDNIIPGLAPPTKQTGMSKSQKKKAAQQKKKAAAADADIVKSLNNTHISEGSKQAVSSDPAKRLRNLKKKLRDIEKLEKQIASGELKNPEPEQKEKVKKKDEVTQQIAELEEELEEES